MRLTHPGSWSIAVKVTLLMLVVSLVPTGVASFLTIRRGLSAVMSASLVDLEQLAATTAAQLDQLITDTQRSLVQLSRDEGVVALCSAKTDQREHLLHDAQHQLDGLVSSNPDYASAFITDAVGVGIVSTNPKNVGQDLTFRDYWKQARDGRLFISGLIVGKTSGQPGVYFSSPILDGGRVVGVAVLKLRGERIWQITDSVRIGKHGYAAITDENGIIIAYPDKNAIFWSLAPLPPEIERTIDPQRRWGVDHVRDLGMSRLRDSLASATEPGSVAFPNPVDGEPWIGGHAPMRSRQWHVSVVEPTVQFMRPMHLLAMQMFASAGIVALLAVLVAIRFARGIVHPIRQLTDAARAVAGGDLTARANVTSEDELGQLARSFDEMVPMLQDRLRLRESMELAMEVQRHLLPSEPPIIPGLDVAGVSIPCDETGGDYFDFILAPELGERTLGLAIGDVTGHGIAAALLMTTGRALLRAMVTTHDDLASLMTAINTQLATDIGEGRFMTMCSMLIDTDRRRVRWVSAGHDPAIVYNPRDDSFIELTGHDIPLGIDPGWTFHEETHEAIEPGCVLCLGTDGIWEARGPDGAMFGKDRLRDIIRQHARQSAQDIVLNVMDALSRFRADQPRGDDITIVVVRFTGDEPTSGPAGP
jgi:serine phosphatase RsbU (regulator of sigma subunit)